MTRPLGGCGCDCGPCAALDAVCPMKPAAWFFDPIAIIAGISGNPEVVGNFNGFCNIFYTGLRFGAGGDGIPFRLVFVRPGDTYTDFAGRMFGTPPCTWVAGTLAGQTSSAVFSLVIDLALDTARNEFVLWLGLAGGAALSIPPFAGTAIAYRAPVATWNCTGSNTLFWSPADWSANPSNGSRLCQDAMGNWPGPLAVTVVPSM